MTDFDFELGMQTLIKSDRDLAMVIQKFGQPPRWLRPPGFATLIHIILEQQVSLASAKAVFARLNSQIDLTPQNLLKLDDLELKQIGFSRQKTRYVRGLADAVATEELDLEKLATADDLTIRNRLKTIKGIGDWTVDMYLMMALQRPDIFPSKDLAVAVAIKAIKNLDTRPKPAALEQIAEQWRPYRAIATQILWHYYLNR